MGKASGNLNVNRNRNLFAVSVAVAIILASALLAIYYVALIPPSNRYMTIYLLDSHQKGTDYPELLVAKLNSTFNVYVYVENHMGQVVDGAQVQVKIADSNTTPEFPLNINATQTLVGTMADGETWERIATVTLDQPGSYLVDFELWIPSGTTCTSQFSGQFCVLNIEVTSGNSTA